MSGEDDSAFVFRFGHCELDEVSGELRVGGTVAEIEPRQRALLLFLLRQAGKVLTKEQLIEEVWGGRVLGDTVVGTAVARVRKAIGDADGKVIRTERNKGYFFAADVERHPAERKPLFELRPGRGIPGRGSWRLIERLGLGGSGEVWLCEDGEQNRRVFKFSLGADHDGALKREVTLSRVLNAALEEDKRQNYVQILEWNIEVHPYYIEFEYAGLNLRTWAAQRGGLSSIPIAQRIDLMARIAAAVGDAHSVGVLHKDLKPDNVLIEERPGNVHVRITDFGAGHLLTREKAEQLDITVRGWTMTNAETKSGTLIWMAPELFEGGGATLQSDLYSLGVMLYQIAIGDFGRVLAPDWHPDVADEVLRDDIDAVTKRSPAQRLADAHELSRRLHALEPRREDRRRRTAADTLAAKAQEIVRRSRARRPYLVATVSALIVGLAVSTYFYVQQVKRTQEARALSDFVNHDLLQAAQPEYGGSPTITLKDAMVRSIALAQKRFANQPQLENQVLQVFGDSFSTLGEYKAMEQVLLRQVQLDMQLHGPSSGQTLSDRLLHSNALLMLGQSTESERELDQVRPLAAAHSLDPAVFPLWMQVETQFAFQKSDFRSAYQATQRLIDFYKKSSNKTKEAEAQLNVAYLTAAQMLLYSGRPQDAEALMSEAMPSVEKGGTEAGPIKLLADEMINSALRDELKFEAAEQGFNTTCSALDHQFGADNKDAAGCHLQQAQLYEDMGRWKEAAALLRNVDAVYEKLDGCPGTSMCIYSKADYAFALSRSGFSSDAHRLTQAALKDAQRSASPDGTLVPHVLYVAGRVASDSGNPEEAQSALSSLKVAIDNPATSEGDWAGRVQLLNATILNSQNQRDKAMNAAQEAKALFEKAPAKSIVELNDVALLLSGAGDRK